MIVNRTPFQFITMPDYHNKLEYGGPDGELGASLRYLSQRYSMPYDEVKGTLTDIGTEESVPYSYQ